MIITFSASHGHFLWLITKSLKVNNNNAFKARITYQGSAYFNTYSRNGVKSEGTANRDTAYFLNTEIK